MARFFDFFPVIAYDISGKQLKSYQAVRNIFFRLRVVREVINNVAAYYEYIVKDYETPEILAERVYGEPEAHWVILMANDVVDAAYDWPLNYEEFNKYMVGKYKNQAATALSIPVDRITDGQVIAWTQTTFHHFEEVIERTESFSDITTQTRFIVNELPYSNTVYYATKKVELILSGINGTFYSGNTVNTTGDIFTGIITDANTLNGYISLSNSSGYFLRDQKIQIANNMTTNGNVSVVISPLGSLPQDSTIPFSSYNDLAETQYVQTFNMGYATKNSTNTLVNAGRTVYQVTYRDRVSNYDYELDLNEKKRTIKIIKPEYYPRILEEFNQFINYAGSPYIRRLIV